MPTRARRPSPVDQAHGAAFAVFLAVNAFLFMRPSDVYEGLLGVEIYQYVIGLCLVLSLPAVLELFSGGRLRAAPGAVCVLCLFPIVVASSLLNLTLEAAFDQIVVFAKIIAYFVLLLALVTTPGRMKVFVSMLVLFAGIMALLSLLDFTHVITLYRPTEINGHKVLFERDRLYGPGLFADPNDLCVILVTMLMLMVGLLCDSRAGTSRLLWLIPGALMAAAFVLTQSRGGLLAFLAGAGLTVGLKFGWRLAAALGLCGVPILFLGLGGRQTEISAGTNTAQERITLWSDGLVLFKESPLVGVGPDQFQRFSGLLAHNSYVQSFAELGFLGAMFFLGAAWLSVAGLIGLGRTGGRAGPPRRGAPPTPRARPQAPAGPEDPTLRHLRPFVAGAVLAYCTGMMTLSLNVMLSTYTVFGLAAAFIALWATRSPPGTTAPSVAPGEGFGPALLVKLAVVALATLVAIFIFVRLTFTA